MLNLFKSGNGLESLLKGAKSFGFNPIEMLEKQLPKWVESVREFEQKAGSDLFITIALDETKNSFVIALFKLTDQGAEMLKNYPLSNLENLINQIHYDLNNISDGNAEANLQQTTNSNPGTVNSDQPAADAAGTSDTGTDTGSEQPNNG